MRTWRLSLLAVLLAATAACHDAKTPKDAKPPERPAVSPPSTELVSLAWKPTSGDQNLQSFELRLTGAEIVSLCNKPPGWIVEGAGDKIKGYATVGAGFVGVEHLDDLDGLFLIQTKAGQPLGVSGKLLTGVYADDGGQSELAATPALLRREPAVECPPPKG
ncbi:hypothetical protein [Caulobacter sp. 602-1]|uniref:hypothetical protein n=1 Tax=Caulobacter sp. 602-1 TaxID=2492472 RepID=UPI000F63FC84|nr:hypothetical protein [Caulobacter sp. 602-1]RRN63733.1 hypothetical protein EIK80_13220 [Caulobacter sp. 602-1]